MKWGYRDKGKGYVHWLSVPLFSTFTFCPPPLSLSLSRSLLFPHSLCWWVIWISYLVSFISISHSQRQKTELRHISLSFFLLTVIYHHHRLISINKFCRTEQVNMFDLRWGTRAKQNMSKTHLYTKKRCLLFKWFFFKIATHRTHFMYSTLYVYVMFVC